MHKVIAYRKRADEYRRRASQATNAKEREAEERMAAAWDLLARTREKQLKEGRTRGT
jgi:vacuolar-type H+-ATPase subunit B/Vma2